MAIFKSIARSLKRQGLWKIGKNCSLNCIKEDSESSKIFLVVHIVKSRNKTLKTNL